MATAVVTGAARGIGREVAIRLAQRGYDVLVTDVNEAGAQETADAIGERAWAIAQDVRDVASHRAVAEAAAERGPVEVWVNNAGVLRTEKVWEHSDDDVRMIVEANLLGVIAGSRAAVEAMRAGGGHLINLGSMSAFGPVPGLAVYGATKHGVVAFSESLQGDLDAAGIPIRVHAVCPDAVDTGMVSERVGDEDAAIIFSAGTKLLDPGEVADRMVALLDSKALVVPIPRTQGAAAAPHESVPAVRPQARGALQEGRRAESAEGARDAMSVVLASVVDVVQFAHETGFPHQDPVPVKARRRRCERDRDPDRHRGFAARRGGSHMAEKEDRCLSESPRTSSRRWRSARRSSTARSTRPSRTGSRPQRDVPVGRRRLRAASPSRARSGPYVPWMA